jgi:hypothetical protein
LFKAEKMTIFHTEKAFNSSLKRVIIYMREERVAIPWSGSSSKPGISAGEG